MNNKFQHDRGYVAFDANMWRGGPRTITSYLQRAYEKRRKVICGPWTWGEVTSADPPKEALKATERIVNQVELWSRTSDSILRSILSIVEFDWVDVPRILANEKETSHYLKIALNAITTLRSGSREFAESQNKIRESRKAGIIGNQEAFKKNREAKNVSLSKKNVDKAFNALHAFDMTDESLKDMCQVFIPIMFASLPGAEDHASKIFTQLDRYLPLKRAMYVFLYQMHRQFILGEKDHSYICDWRTLIEMPENCVLVTRDTVLCESAKLCKFNLPIISEAECYRI